MSRYINWYASPGDRVLAQPRLLLRAFLLLRYVLVSVSGLVILAWMLSQFASH